MKTRNNVQVIYKKLCAIYTKENTMSLYQYLLDLGYKASIAQEVCINFDGLPVKSKLLTKEQRKDIYEYYKAYYAKPVRKKV